MVTLEETLIDIQQFLCTMHLPTELLLEILQNLSNGDLKTVRLANKELSECAAGFLFRTLYISKQKEDLDAFEGATNHPLIRKCVKALKYDAVVFSTEVSEAEYSQKLWYQVCNMLHIDADIPPYDRQTPFDSPDPQIDEFVRHCRNATQTAMNLDTLYRGRESYRVQHAEEFMEFAFIKRGYRNWMERATYERLHMQDQDFLRVLVPGLQKLDHLDSVSLSGEWRCDWTLRGFGVYSEISKCTSGTLVQRNWDPFILLPLEWYLTPSDLKDSNHASTGPFWTITSALSKASKQPRVFECESLMVPATLKIKAEGSRVDTGMLADGCRAFAGLKKLSLQISSFFHNSRLGTHDKLTALQEMLNHMSMLETLELNLPWTVWNTPWPTFRYDLMFPESGIWKRLTTFSIGSLAIHLHEFVELLFLKMPNLRRLHLDHFSLLEGRWQAMIELFKFGLRSLERFRIDQFTQLYHCEYTNLSVQWRHQDLLVDLENYILNGRDNLNLRHPCLQPEDPNRKSLAYLTELLRQCEEKGPHGSLAAGVVQTQIDYGTMAYRRWERMRFEAMLGEQASGDGQLR